MTSDLQDMLEPLGTLRADNLLGLCEALISQLRYTKEVRNGTETKLLLRTPDYFELMERYGERLEDMKLNSLLLPSSG
jgi:hypothetical protein